ncbi:MAG: gfo/Idh/MocA family oxidoreductase, partial [Pirellulales bacterium]|nr:gfo/Idh/MocA family oxidoreductase [Pirellulales bacterium]
ATVHMFKDQHIDKKNIEWSPEDDKKSPWDYEWMHFIQSIRADKPHNECHRAVKSDYATLMGRAAAHSNNIVTWDQVVNSKFQFCDYLDTINENSPAPVKADKDGFFPQAVAGHWKEL